MAIQAVQAEGSAGNRKLTDPREAYEAMHNLVKSTENQLFRIHSELNLLAQAYQAMTWNDYEFDTDAWLRLLSNTVAQVENLRSDVEHGNMDGLLRATEEERAEEDRKRNVFRVMTSGAEAVLANKVGADRIIEVVESVMAGEVRNG